MQTTGEGLRRLADAWFEREMTMGRKTGRRWTAAVGAVLVATSLAACGGDGDGDDAAAGTKVGYSATSLGDAYRVILAKQAEIGAKEEGLDLQAPTDANNDPAKQITDVTTMLSQGVDGVMMVVLDSKAIKPALDRAEKKGVPVVAIDQGPADGKVAITVRGDSVLMGRQSCEMLAEQLDGKGKVLELQGALDGLVGRERSEGFNACMKEKYPGITVVSKPTQWLQEKASTAAQTVLSTDKAVNGVFLASDAAMLPGIIKVLERMGRLKPAGTSGHLPLVTIDGSPYALEQVRKGYVDGLVSQPLSDYARWAAHYMKRSLDGEAIETGKTDHDSEIIEENGNLSDVLPTPTVTKENVDDPALWGNQAGGDAGSGDATR